MSTSPSMTISSNFADISRRRYVLGIGVILLVVLCWVGGDELTQVIFKKEKFNKPFFVVYFKSAMFMVYLVRLVKYLPTLLSSCVVPGRNPDDLLGPSSYERLEYDRDNDSDMTGGSDDDDLISSEIRELNDQTSRENLNRVGINHQSKKSALKKQCTTHQLTTPPSPPPSALPSLASSPPPSTRTPPSSTPPSSTHPLETSRRIKFRPVAEVRCLASHNMTLQREARRPYLHRAGADNLPLRAHLRVALIYSLLWFIGNYLNALALQRTSLSYVEVLSATSSVFVLLLSAIFPVGVQDRISLTKLCVVVVNMGGVIVLCFDKQQGPAAPDPANSPSNNMFGIMFALSSSLLYSIYVVYFRRVAGSPDSNDDRVDIVLFFGTVGVISAVCLIPMFPILHYSEVELFTWPHLRDWKYLVLTALLGTVISDLLWLWSTLLTTSLIATLGLGLTTPVSILVDIMVNKRSFNTQFFIGSVLIVCSFIIVNILSIIEYSDPVLDWAKKLKRNLSLMFGCRPELENQAEGQSLLESNSNHNIEDQQTSLS